MNRIALCIYGLPRGNSSVWNKIFKLSEHHNCDVFVHSWLKPSTRTNHLGVRIDQDLDYSRFLDFFKDRESVKKIVFENQLKYKFKSNKVDNDNKSNQLNSLISMNNSIDLAISYALANNNSYDHFIVTRLDCDLLKLDFNLFKFKSNFSHLGYFNQATNTWEWEDVFFIIKGGNTYILTEVIVKYKEEFYFEKNIRNILLYEIEENKLDITSLSGGKKVIDICRKKTFSYLLYAIRYKILKRR
jgi:hypothetical protein